MRHFTLALVLSVAAGCSGSSTSSTARINSGEDSKRLQGEWIAVAVTGRGQEAPLAELTEKERTCTVTEDRIRIWHGEGLFRLDEAANPKTINITIDKGEALGRTLKGIYSLEGDQLKLCLGEPGGERPTEFKSEAGSRVLLLTYRRQ